MKDLRAQFANVPAAISGEVMNLMAPMNAQVPGEQVRHPRSGAHRVERPHQHGRTAWLHTLVCDVYAGRYIHESLGSFPNSCTWDSWSSRP